MSGDVTLGALKRLDSVLAGQDIDSVDINGGSIDGVAIGASTPSTGAFTSVVTGGTQAAVGATKTLTAADSGVLNKLDTAAGSVATLPAATGTGNIFRFAITVIATSNSHVIKVGSASETMQGFVFSMDDTSANVVGFFAAGASDTITLNKTTTGSVTIGEYIEIEDIATNKFQVRGFISNTGSPATPFSATV